LQRGLDSPSTPRSSPSSSGGGPSGRQGPETAARAARPEMFKPAQRAGGKRSRRGPAGRASAPWG
jgi:hypothetical protein